MTPMKHCTICGATTSSKMVYDLPCDAPGCKGMMVLIETGTPEVSLTEVVHKAAERFDALPPERASLETQAELRSSRKFVIARVGDSGGVVTARVAGAEFNQVIAFIERRAVALGDLGADAAADLLRNLIVALRVEFRS